jgi:methionyl-tRNA formyltransferase
MRVAFAGTPEFAREILQRVTQAGFVVPLALTQPDRPAGRGLRPHASAVKTFACASGIPVEQPRGLRLDGRFAPDARRAHEALLAANADVIVVAAYGLLLPGWVLALPRFGCINVHASLLPRWRGAAPIQRAIEAGDRQTGVTIMQMDAGLDTGDTLLARPLAIAADDSAATLQARLAGLGAELIVEALRLAQRGKLTRVAQPGTGVTYARKVDKSEAPIDWSHGAEVIERRIRAFDPFPGASCRLGEDLLKCWRAEVTDLPDATAAARAGEIVAVDRCGPTVACGTGALRLTELQRSGGRRLPAREFMSGQPLQPGMCFAQRAS